MSGQAFMVAGVRVLNGAPTQLERAIDPLVTHDVPVDGRSQTELLDFAVRFGALVNFYDLEDRVDGDWVELFLCDPTMILATIIETDLGALEGELLALIRRLGGVDRAEAGRRLLRRVGEWLLRLARRIELWRRGAGRAGYRSSGRLLARNLDHQLRSRLVPAVQALKALDLGAGQARALGRPLGLDYRGLSSQWGLEAVAANPSGYRGDTLGERLESAARTLERLFTPLRDALADLQSFARGELAAALAEEGHKPQIALYIAFAQLFRSAQATVNATSARYARFYYREVLRERPDGPRPDQLYLAFALADEEGVATTQVPAGTLFSAGQDADGKERLFSLDQAVRVAAGRFGHVRTLRRVAGPLYLPVPPSSFQAPLEVTVALMAGEAACPDPAVTPPENPDAAWPTFGPVAPGSDAAGVALPATIGFALASRYLQLAGGTRTIEVELDCGVAYAAEVLVPRLCLLSGVTGVDPNTLLETLLEGAFEPFLSTAGVWLPVAGYEVVVTRPVCCPQQGTPKGGDAPAAPAFTLRLELPPTVPPIVPFGSGAEETEVGEAGAADPYAADPAPGLPTLKLYLRQSPVILGDGGEGDGGEAVEVQPLALLGSLEVGGVGLRVEVAGLAPERLANSDGEIDPSAPFPAFGGLAVVGSQLLVGAEELFVKRPESIDLALEWFDLPQDPGGFYGYYRDYVIGPDGERHCDLFDNQVFGARIDLLNPGPWRLEAEEVSLFRAEKFPDGETPPSQPGCDPQPVAESGKCADPEPPAVGPLCAETLFAGLEPLPNTPPAYYDPAAGALRLTLERPGYAFGADLYPSNVLYSVILALPNAGACQDGCLELCRDQQGSEKYAACIDACMTECMQIETPLRYPNEPYLPQLTAVHIDYSAGCSLLPAAENACAELYQLTAFGGYAPVPLPEEGGGTSAVSLLPLPAEPGNLLLGLDPPAPGKPLSLLVQMAGAAAVELPPVTWQILHGNRWEDLTPAELPLDGTHGLQGSGLLLLEIPDLVLGAHTILEAGHQWLRVTAPERPGEFPATVGIYPYAGLATARLHGEDVATDPSRPIPAGTIVASVQDLPDVGLIVQPMPSFGGRAAEDRSRFQVRMGERLRHKERVLLAWDYQRLVLERFPEVWQVGVLPVHTAEAGHTPGAVLVVVLPGPEGQELSDPTVPQASGALLGRIEAYLAARSSAFARIRVINPHYVRIEVSAEVVFIEGGAAGFDEGAGVDRLDRELVEYLSPWFYDAARAATAGRYVTEAGIADFIQTRPYVAALAGLELNYSPGLDARWCYLTSATGHRIRAVSDANCGQQPCRQ